VNRVRGKGKGWKGKRGDVQKASMQEGIESKSWMRVEPFMLVGWAR